MCRYTHTYSLSLQPSGEGIMFTNNVHLTLPELTELDGCVFFDLRTLELVKYAFNDN